MITPVDYVHQYLVNDDLYLVIKVNKYVVNDHLRIVKRLNKTIMDIIWLKLHKRSLVNKRSLVVNYH